MRVQHPCGRALIISCIRIAEKLRSVTTYDFTQCTAYVTGKQRVIVCGSRPQVKWDVDVLEARFRLLVEWLPAILRSWQGSTVLVQGSSATACSVVSTRGVGVGVAPSLVS